MKTMTADTTVRSPHRRRLLPTLRSRLLFLICLATLPAILFTFFAAHQESRATLSRAEGDARHLARLMTREHVNQIAGARSLILWLGTRLADEGAASPILRDPGFLAALLAGHPQLANVGVLSARGEVLVSAYPVESFASWSDHPAFRLALDAREPVSGTYLVSPIFGRPTLNHAYAVRDRSGRVTAVLFSGLDLNWLSNLARGAVFSEQPLLLLLDRRGRVLASGGQDLAQGADLGIGDVAALAGSGSGLTVLEDAPEGPRLMIVEPLSDLPEIYVAVGLPYEEVLQESRSAFYRTLAGLGLLTLFTIAAVYVAAEVGVLRALRALVQTVRRFGRGDLSARAATPEGYGELGSLAHAFNTMADELSAKHHQALEAQERLRALARRVQSAREEEAARISRELHDEIGQLLTSLKLDLSALPARCAHTADLHACADALRDDVEQMGERLAAALEFVRRIAGELRPAVLDRLGLREALEWMGEETERRTDLTVHVDAEETLLPEDVSVALFRITQEALTNVVRHARAGHVEVRLRASEDTVRLEVIDDGTGIADDVLDRTDSLGIAGMRERASLIGGRLSVSPAPDGGTAVRVALPRPKEAAHEDPAR